MRPQDAKTICRLQRSLSVLARQATGLSRVYDATRIQVAIVDLQAEVYRAEITMARASASPTDLDRLNWAREKAR